MDDFDTELERLIRSVKTERDAALRRLRQAELLLSSLEHTRERLAALDERGEVPPLSDSATADARPREREARVLRARMDEFLRRQEGVDRQIAAEAYERVSRAVDTES